MPIPIIAWRTGTNPDLQAALGSGAHRKVVSSVHCGPTLFLDYAFDVWMRRNHPAIAFKRYADDVICHSHSEKEARRLMEALQDRFALTDGHISSETVMRPPSAQLRGSGAVAADRSA